MNPIGSGETGQELAADAAAEADVATPAQTMPPGGLTKPDRERGGGAGPGADLLFWGMVAAALGSGMVIARLRLHHVVSFRRSSVAGAGPAGGVGGARAGWETEGVVSDPVGLGVLLIVGAVLVWSAQPVGANSAHALLGLNVSGSGGAVGGAGLRDQALMQLGGYVGALLSAAVLFACVPMLRGEAGLRLGRRGADIVLGIAGMALTFPIAWLLGVVMIGVATLISMRLGGTMPDPVSHSTLEELLQSPRDAWWWVTVGSVVVLTPAVEELIYRGLLQSGIVRLTGSPKAGLLIAGFLFMLVHIGAAEWHALPTLFLLGAAFGLAFERTGRLAVPITMHAVFNGANVVLLMV